MRQAVIQKAEEKQRRQQPNLTGIPTQMKMDFEQRSGLSFDDVRVHYNSDKPRKIGALAYTQGTQVHIGPGQERHLRHELGHVVQQKQGIVRPTTWINGLPVNNSPHLERLADTMQDMRTSVHGIKLPQVPAVQCAAGQVAVSLSPKEGNDYTLGELNVDSVKVHGRFDTSLKIADQQTQGHHVVADILIKKHQLHMFRNLDASAVVDKYHEMSRMLSPPAPAVVATTASAPAPVAAAATPATPAVAVMNAPVFPSPTGSASPSTNFSWLSSERVKALSEFNQIKNAFELQRSLLLAHGKASINVWRKQFNLLVWLYNNAYSHSNEASVIIANVPSKGRGESSIAPNLITLLNLNIDQITQINNTKKLKDEIDRLITTITVIIDKGYDPATNQKKDILPTAGAITPARQRIKNFFETLYRIQYTYTQCMRSRRNAYTPEKMTDKDVAEKMKIVPESPFLMYIMNDYFNKANIEVFLTSLEEKAKKLQPVDGEPPTKRARTEQVEATKASKS